MPFYLTVTDLDTGGNPQTANGTVPKGSGPREGFETAVDGYSVAPSKGLLIICTFKDGIFFENLNYADPDFLKRFSGSFIVILANCITFVLLLNVKHKTKHNGIKD